MMDKMAGALMPPMIESCYQPLSKKSQKNFSISFKKAGFLSLHYKKIIAKSSRDFIKIKAILPKKSLKAVFLCKSKMESHKIFTIFLQINPLEI